MRGSVFLEQSSPCGSWWGRSEPPHLMWHLLAVRDPLHSAASPEEWGWFALPLSQVTNRSTLSTAVPLTFHRTFDWLGIIFLWGEDLVLAGWIFFPILFSYFRYNWKRDVASPLLVFVFLFVWVFFILSLNYQSVWKPWMFPGEEERRGGQGKGQHSCCNVLFISFKSLNSGQSHNSCGFNSSVI